MAYFDVTSRYAQTITSVLEGQTFEQFPLLSRLRVVDSDVLQTFKVVDGLAGNFETKVLGDGKAYTHEIVFHNNGDITQGAINVAVDMIARQIYKDLEKDMVESALAHSTGTFVQGMSDFILTNDNDYVPLSIPKYQVDYFKTAKTIAINPDTGVLFGEVTPTIVMSMDMQHNKVKVYGTMRCLGAWYADNVTKEIGGNA